MEETGYDETPEALYDEDPGRTESLPTPQECWNGFWAVLGRAAYRIWRERQLALAKVGCRPREGIAPEAE